MIRFKSVYCMSVVYWLNDVRLMKLSTMWSICRDVGHVTHINPIRSGYLRLVKPLVRQEFFEFSKSIFVTESARRRLNNICVDLIWTLNERSISLLIFSVIVSFLRNEWALTNVAEWLCSDFTIFINQASLSSSRMIITKKKHSILLLLIWRRSWSRESMNFLSRSHINHAFLRTSNLNFFVRSIIIAYF
jgi:hypothetical protein